MKRARAQFLKAYERLERLAPPRARQVLHWLHRPDAKPVRIPVAILCLIGAMFSFLPLLGIELLPLGLLLLAHDVPSLRQPAARMTMWFLDKYEMALKFCRKQHAACHGWWRCAQERRRLRRRAAAVVPVRRPRATSTWASRSKLRHDRAA